MPRRGAPRPAFATAAGGHGLQAVLTERGEVDQQVDPA